MKKILISSVAMFALAFAVSASAATVEDMGSMTLKKGSTGSYVMALQQNLNACAGMSLVTDGIFGKGTAAATMSFQSSKGLSTDALVGPMTKAALTAACGGSTTVTTTVPGCMPGALFSSTTGASCTGTSSTVISGGAGNIQSIITLGSPSSVTVSEGDTNKSVLGFEVKADAGSDLKVSNVAIKIAKFAGSGSTWVSRYINKVSIMQGSTVIGSIDAASLSQNGNDYTANIAVDNAIIKANQNAQFYVAVNGNSTIDSADSGSTLTATVTSIRYMDATGAVLTNSATGINQSFTLQKLSDSANVKIQVSEDNNNPTSRTVTSNYTSTTNDVSLLKFNVIANGTNMNFNKITAVATATGVSDLTQVSQLFKLKYNGNVISTVNYNTTVGGTSATLAFGDTSTVSPYTATSLNGGSSLVISAGQTGSFEILADVKPMATGGPSATVFDAGDTLKVNLPSSEVLNNWAVLDQSGNNIATNTINRQGSATGYDATFRVQGLSSQLTTGAPANNNVYNSTSGTYTASTVYMNVSVTAAGSDFFIPRTVAIATSGTDSTSSASAGFLIAKLDNAYAYDGSGTMTGSVSIVSGASVDSTTPAGSFKVPAGQTAVFQVSANIGGAPSAGVKYVQLNAVRGDIDSALGSIATYPTIPAASFQSSATAAF